MERRSEIFFSLKTLKIVCETDVSLIITPSQDNVGNAWHFLRWLLSIWLAQFLVVPALAVPFLEIGGQLGHATDFANWLQVFATQFLNCWDNNWVSIEVQTANLTDISRAFGPKDILNACISIHLSRLQGLAPWQCLLKPRLGRALVLPPLLERRGLLIILVQIVVLHGCLFVVVCTQLWAVDLLIVIKVHLLVILVIAFHLIQGKLVHLLLDVICVSEHYFTKSRLCVYMSICTFNYSSSTL